MIEANILFICTIIRNVRKKIIELTFFNKYMLVNTFIDMKIYP